MSSLKISRSASFLNIMMLLFRSGLLLQGESNENVCLKFKTIICQDIGPIFAKMAKILRLMIHLSYLKYLMSLIARRMIGYHLW